ncbi:MAG: DUF962 domain-containing protein [Polyangiaceae bacterium]|jgi:hypothetical protein|nr:DUF962 domain-containing protein [Polyangiaceae bacterium]
MAEKITDFESFWPYYIGEHRDASTRRLHTVGTTVALGCLAAFALTRKRSLLLATLVGGYGPAWVSHFFIEKNRPATFTYPLWSLRADLRMFRLTLLGQIDAEVERILGEQAAEGAAEAAPTNGASANGKVGNGATAAASN